MCRRFNPNTINRFDYLQLGFLNISSSEIAFYLTISLPARASTFLNVLIVGIGRAVNPEHTSKQYLRRSNWSKRGQVT